jgi:[histone H3]-lysine36 N-dimethyltransferase SETMAR
MSSTILSPSGVDDYIRTLSSKGLSQYLIKKELKKVKINKSQSYISRVINLKTKKSKRLALMEVSPNKPRGLVVRTPEVIRKTRAMLKAEHPLTQKTMANKLKISPRSLRRVIKENLKRKVVKKSRVHSLNEIQKRRRKTAARMLYELYLSGDKYKKVVTVDEAWVYMHNTGRRRSIYYALQDRSDDKHWVRFREQNPKGFMIVAGVCFNGKLLLKKVEPKVKINSNYYSEKCLPLIFKDIQKLYPKNQLKEVFFHQDLATSHFSRYTTRKLDQLKSETGINYIPRHHIPVKSPDISPMDFCVFGLVKRGLWRHKPKNLKGLWKALQIEWKRLPQEVIQRALESWKSRCRLVVKKCGEHIEHIRHLK